MNLLPLKEWPVSYPSAIQVGTHYVVSIESLSRVQIYDHDLNFQKSVWVNSQGGVIYLYPQNENSFWVYTLKSHKKLHINLAGEKLLAEKYEEYERPKITAPLVTLPIAASPWLNSFSLLLIGAISFIVSIIANSLSKARQ